MAAPAEPSPEVERTAGAVAAAATPVPLPDLGLAARRGDGGITLFRMPLSELEAGFGVPQVVRGLPASSGYLYDRIKVLAGDFANFSVGDDGTADHILWRARGDGSIAVDVVAGGSSTTPRPLRVLSRSAGWSWTNSRPMVGDVNGDGWDDLVVRHASSRTRVNTFVLLSDGQTLGAPVHWLTEPHAQGVDKSRYLAGDFAQPGGVSADGADDLVKVWHIIQPGGRDGGFQVDACPNVGTGFDPQCYQIANATTGGWSYPASRHLVGDVTGDGDDDLVTIHSGRNGLTAWTWPSDHFWDPAELWADLRSGGWSYTASRQYLADTDGDYLADLISVHRSGTGGIAVFRHISDGTSFAAPELIANLRGGWNWSLSRESVANTWGEIL